MDLIGNRALTGLVLAALIASPVVATADHVMMKDGSLFEVRGFEIAGSVVAVALPGRTWPLRSELVDLEGTRQANGMSSADVRSPGWSGRHEPVAVEGEEALEAMAKARAEYEEALRSITREQEQLRLRIKELAIAKTAHAETLEESRAEPSPAPAQTPADNDAALARVIAEYEEAIRLIKKAQEELERRVAELEAAKTAQEDATRAIIRDAASKLGSKINQSVAFGGDLEGLVGRFKDASGRSESLVELSTAQIDFEIQVNDWTLGSLIFEYLDGRTTPLQTIEGRPVAVDRLTIDTAFLRVGDEQRFPLSATIGQVIVPFGISTGDPVADVLTLEGPLTIEAFEMRQTAFRFDVGFPTPRSTPPPPPVAPPPVRPLVINPFFNWLGKGLGYHPPPARPVQPTPVSPPPAPPLFNLGVVAFQGSSFPEVGIEGKLHFGATAGFRKKWDCGSAYDERRGGGWRRSFCPLSIDVDVDYNDSVFDSRFLGFEYGSFRRQIGSVPGMASSLKATVGPLSFVGEWNGAVADAAFTDDLGARSIRPRAWQVSLGYQFDWNPWVEAIGAQGDYLAVSYSESRDLAGVIRSGERVGFVPWKRFSVGVGEWVLDGLRLALEYSRDVDYPVSQGGAGKSTSGVFSTFTYTW